MNFDNYLFHPSTIGRLMTSSRVKGEEFGETAKAYLLEIWIKEKYGRTKEYSNQYLEKGTLEEETSIDLYSLVRKKFFEKNKQHFSNEYFIGTPDIIDTDLVIDIKTSFTIHTFYETMLKPINKDYVYQLNAYMNILNVKNARLVYCLVNTPFHLIEDQKKKLYWKLGVIDEQNDERYIQGCEQIDKNNLFDDIPMDERYIEYHIERDQELIDFMHDKIINARKFLNQL